MTTQEHSQIKTKLHTSYSYAPPTTTKRPQHIQQIHINTTTVMVKVGDFSVELVRADTKEVFKEHTSPVDNRIYAEVEPDVDYLVRVGSNTGDVLCRLLVDGVDLGYNQNFLSPNNSVCAGAFEIKNGKQTMSALHLNKTRDKRHGAMPSMLTGKVEVIFYKIGRKEYKILNDWSST